MGLFIKGESRKKNSLFHYGEEGGKKKKLTPVPPPLLGMFLSLNCILGSSSCSAGRSSNTRHRSNCNQASDDHPNL